MKDSAFTDLIETFNDMESFTPEKLQKRLQGALQSFQAVQHLIDSADPAQKAEGIKQAFEMRQALQAQAERLCQSLGIDSAQLFKLAEKEPFSPKTREILEATKEELERAKPKKMKKRNPNKTWITG